MNHPLPQGLGRIFAVCLAALLTACTSFENLQVSAPLLCDMQGIGQIKIDAHTQILAVQNFKAGDEVRLANSAAPHIKAVEDVCMVKLVVARVTPARRAHRLPHLV